MAAPLSCVAVLKGQPPRATHLPQKLYHKGMVMQIQITVEDEGVKYELERIAGRLRNLKPVMQMIGEVVRRSVEQNFAKTPPGRPMEWKISERVRKLGGQTLTDRAILRRSISVKGYTDSVAVGTNVVYAAIHQMGFDGMVNVRAHTRRVRSRDVKEKYQYTRYDRVAGIEIKTGRRIVAKGIANVKAFARHMEMPARPFLMVQTEDWAEIRRELAGYVVEGEV